MAENTRPRTMDGDETDYYPGRFYLIKTFCNSVFAGFYQMEHIVSLHWNTPVSHIETAIELDKDKLWQMIGGKS